ncbi:hypothetical protein DPMN_032926 [Dreissena polymorpha]|uniref:Uncharacterized protein n=1 Tax=Dreissena polymorpha TaxID=45954 RepID=A0A9D4M7K2_DREPO|nr:hypothetical protein DPMN_032926 [Dreissena polymorpha]
MRKKRRSPAGQHSEVTERSQLAIETPYDQCSAGASHEDHQYDYISRSNDDGYLKMTAGLRLQHSSAKMFYRTAEH